MYSYFLTSAYRKNWFIFWLIWSTMLVSNLHIMSLWNLSKCLIENIIFQISVKFHSYWNALRIYGQHGKELRVMVFNKLVFLSLKSNFRTFLYFFIKVRIIPEVTSGYTSKVQIISKHVMCICWFFLKAFQSLSMILAPP